MEIHYGADDLHLVNPVVTIGSFDGVHKGHVQVIHSLRKVAARLGGESVIISFEPHPREVLYPMEKRPGMLTTLDEKIRILTACGVEHLIIMPFTLELAALDYADFVRHILVEKIGMKGLVVGYDHRFGKNREGTFGKLECLAKEYGFYLEQEKVYEENCVNISSTKIRNALLTGDIAQANDFLGYGYSLTGTVVAGDKIGRTIGFPTANVRLEGERKQLPAAGVYAVRVAIGETVRKGMLNIGIRPTVSTAGTLRIEVHIFDFDRDIYGEEMTITLVARIRGEQKFKHIEELKQQLLSDRRSAESCF